MSAFGRQVNYTGVTQPNMVRQRASNSYGAYGNQGKVTSGMAMPNYGSGQRSADFSAYQPQVKAVTGGGFPVYQGNEEKRPASTGSRDSGNRPYGFNDGFTMPRSTPRPGGYTTLAMGEEDGGMPPRPPSQPQAPPRLPPGMATTMAVGEEDGGMPFQMPAQPQTPPRLPPGVATTMAVGEEDGGVPAQPYVAPGGGGQSQNGFANLAPAMGGMPAGFGAPENVSFDFAGFGGPPFSAAYQGFDGRVTDSPNYNQRDAFISNINNQLGMQQMQGFNTPRPAPPQLDFNQLWSQAGDMARGGWTNPLAGLFL